MISDVRVCHDLVDQLSTLGEVLGTTSHTTTVASWYGGSEHTMVLSAPLPTVSGDHEAWRNTIVEVVSSTNPKMKAMYAIVEGAEGNGARIRLASPFPKNRKPLPGDTIKISGGPLGAAVIYFANPDSIEQDITDGKVFFVMVNSLEGSYETTGLSGSDRVRRGQSSTECTVDFEITCETFLTTGSAVSADGTEYIQTEDSIYRAIYDAPKLKEQVAREVMRYLAAGCDNNFASPSIDWEYAMGERANRRLMKITNLSTSVTTR